MSENAAADEVGRLAEDRSAWLVVKRGLYWRPLGLGYTGLKENAGRYTEADARSLCHDDGEPVTMIREDDAPDVAPGCCPHVAAEWISKQQDRAGRLVPATPTQGEDALTWMPISEAKRDGTLYVMSDGGDGLAIGEWDQLEGDGWYNHGGFDRLEFRPTRCLLIPSDDLQAATPTPPAPSREELREQIARAAFDPSVYAGPRGDRYMAHWVADAVLAVLPAPSRDLVEAMRPFARLADEVDALAAELKVDPAGIARSCDYQWLVEARAALSVTQAPAEPSQGAETAMREALNAIDAKCEVGQQIYETESDLVNPLIVAKAFAIVRDVARAALSQSAGGR